jgi:hypothetical protein
MTALLTTDKIWKKSSCPLVDGWIPKWWYIHNMKYFSALERKCTMKPYSDAEEL